MASVTLHPAEGDLDYAQRLLSRSDLPVEDITASSVEIYYATAAAERIGVGGLEEYGDVGLLRSVVVEPSKRGQGYGTMLCESLETIARNCGVETLYLLTTTASDFFASAGYTTIERSIAPDAVQNTAEFEELCPSTAVCMKKTL